MSLLGIALALSMSQDPPHVVLLAGDEEYRSEEAMPQLAAILRKNGFACTVLYSLDESGDIDPEENVRYPGIEALDTADACVTMLRFRRWPEETMKHFAGYVETGRPIIALRTSTHAFDYPASSANKYRHFGWRSEVWPGGFGKQILGETWVSHWGDHGSQGTRGVPVAEHPVLFGVNDLFVTTDVYEAHPPSDATILMRGQVVAGMNADAAAFDGRKTNARGIEQHVNDPMMPVVWVRGKHVVSTMGSAKDLLDAGFRRLLVNAVVWATGFEFKQEPFSDLVGDYRPSPFGFGKFKRGVKPEK